MKRAMTILGALTLVAGFFMTAPAANAAPTCVTYPVPPVSNTPIVNENNWPQNTDPGTNPAVSMAYYCGTATNPILDAAFTWVLAQAQIVADHGTNDPPDRLAKTYTDNHQRIYLFNNLADLNSYWGTSYTDPSGSFILGVTLGSKDTHNASIPVGSVGILKARSDGTTIAQGTVRATVNHELGHALDRIKGFPSTLGSSNYTTNKNNDIFELNHMTRAAAFSGVTIPSSCQSLYNAPWDPNTQTGTSNWTVAECVFGSAIQETEFFANVFGWRIGGSIVNVALSSFIAAHFPDTFTYMDSLVNNGTP